MSSAVIIATSYDTPCNYTFAWAMKLKDGLLKQGHSCVLIPGEGICAAGATLSEAIDRSDFVVFLGHGTANELTRLPSRGAISSLAALWAILALDWAVRMQTCTQRVHMLVTNRNSFSNMKTRVTLERL